MKKILNIFVTGKDNLMPNFVPRSLSLEEQWNHFVTIVGIFLMKFPISLSNADRAIVA